MRRLRTTDAGLLLSLLLLWIACAALHIKQVAAGQLAWVSVYVTAPSTRDEFPTVGGFWPGATPDATGALAVGDRLLAVGDVDLRDVGPFGFAARVYATAAEQGQARIPLTYQRGGTTGRTSIELVPVAFAWRLLPLACALVATSALVLARRPGSRTARALFLGAIGYGLRWTFFFGGPSVQTYAWTAIFFCSSLVTFPLILRAARLFPAGTAAGARLPWWPWLFAVYGPISLSWVYGVPLSPELGFRAMCAVNAVFIVALLAVLTRNFRRADAVGRRQLKWVVLGIYIGTVPVLLTDVGAAVAPQLWWLHDVSVIAELCIPLCVLIAIVRENFLDVDRLITGTAVYSLLSVLVLAAVLTAVPQIARAASLATNLDPHTVQLVLSIVVAACIVPGQRWLRPRVERLLFRERHALSSGAKDLLRELAAAGGPQQLLTLVGERLDSLVCPHACVIYAPFGDAFAPVFARVSDEDGEPPALAADAALIVALRARSAPLDLTSWTYPDEALAVDERAALERLRAAVVLPVRRGDALAGAICLGAKRSGDIYTEPTSPCSGRLPTRSPASSCASTPPSSSGRNAG